MRPAGADVSGAGAGTSFPDVIHLNVGGIRFTTTLDTLRKDPGSYLCKMFSGQTPVTRGSDGVYLIDRDGHVFLHILNFLRDGSLPLGLSHSLRLELLREALFYEIGKLHEKLGGKQDPRSPGCILGATPNSRGDPPEVRSAAIHPGGFRGRPARRPQLDVQAAGRHLASDAFPDAVRWERFYIRLRYGFEYSGEWIVSSPRNLPGVEYELHDACLARGPVSAMNKLTKAGWQPCEDPPRAPPVRDFYTDSWTIYMYKDFVRGSKEWDQWRKGRPSSQVVSPQHAGLPGADRRQSTPRLQAL
mmetsp:Transcript_110617/g.345891  ORF Transcript_110617/g.345891 Transcript_110617/m.345891 type:complete len:302 (-) Transcript_110617:25-930(-)